MARLAGSLLRVNRYRVSRLYSPHGGSLHFDRGSLSGRAVFRLERLQEWFTDGMVFVCDFERRSYAEKVGKPFRRHEVVYNGVGEADFEIVPETPDAVHFLYVGMLRDRTGPDIVVDAGATTERLLTRPLSAMMIGDGPQRQKYLDMMTVRGLGRRITMLPAMNIREAFTRSQNVVVPSRAESMPYIVRHRLGRRRHLGGARQGQRRARARRRQRCACPRHGRFHHGSRLERDPHAGTRRLPRDLQLEDHGLTRDRSLPRAASRVGIPSIVRFRDDAPDAA